MLSFPGLVKEKASVAGSCVSAGENPSRFRRVLPQESGVVSSKPARNRVGVNTCEEIVALLIFHQQA